MSEEEWVILVARFESMCYGCGGMIQKRSVFWHNKELKQSKHLMCKNKVLSDEDL